MKKPSRKPAERTAAKPPVKGAALSGLRRGMTLELLIERLDPEGMGVAHFEGATILVAGALPQDRCLARISHLGQTVTHADLIKLTQPSELRTKRPICGEAEHCLGCALIGMRYAEQVRWKHEQVRAELAAYPTLKKVPVLEPLSPNQRMHYRTTAKLAVAGTHREPYIGIYRRASHDVVDLEDCPLHHALVNRVVKATREGISKLKVPIWQEKNKTGVLRYLVVRVSASSNEVMVTFVTYRRAFNEIHHLARFVQEQVPQVVVTCQNVNSSEGNVIFGPHDHFLTKQQTVQDRIGEVEVLISPRSFLQVNNEAAALLYNAVLERAGLTGKQTVLDLYCGIGGIALTLAPHAKRVVGIEMNTEAVADARRNARLNNRRNCRFEAGDVRELLADSIEDEQRFDLVVLNPPRKGCDREVLQQVAELAPQRIVYVSCSPQTLARDLDILASLGYACRELQPVDMFPQTPHVENVALLERIPVKTA
ncbi:MAG: 23S rRNA (uracil(1939)-C(5))-methyltransferase RlmD [Geobacter sp.]